MGTRPHQTTEAPRSTVRADLQYRHGASRFALHASRPTNKGFTLIEIIVILAVISILVAILTPTVLKYIEDAQLSKAEEDVKVINATLNDLIKDTGQFPGSKLATGKTFLCGSGTQLGGPWGDATTCGDLSKHLVVNNPNEDATTDSTGDYRTTGKRRYKGPYVQSLGEDPWGNAYQVNASTLTGGNNNPTWVISAGPDAIFQSATSATELAGDDVGLRIK